MQQIKSEFPRIEVVMLTAYGNVENAVHAMRLGAFDCLNAAAAKVLPTTSS